MVIAVGTGMQLVGPAVFRLDLCPGSKFSSAGSKFTRGAPGLGVYLPLLCAALQGYYQ